MGSGAPCEVGPLGGVDGGLLAEGGEVMWLRRARSYAPTALPASVPLGDAPLDDSKGAFASTNGAADCSTNSPAMALQS